MKKTLTVNLAGRVFYIDEDAYLLLDNYLHSLQSYFRKAEGGAEIIADMESRIAELFAEKLYNEHSVVSIELVKEVIEQMGKPEQLVSEDEETSSTAEEASKTESTEVPPLFNTSKRLYRNPDDMKLGGVASGIAAYMGIDAIWVRLLFVLLAVFTKVFPILLIYVVLWFLLPEASTAMEKLHMRGEPINMDSIGQTVNDSFADNKPAAQENALQSVLHFFFNVLGIAVKLLLICLVICLLPFAFFFLVVALTILLAIIGVLAAVPIGLGEIIYKGMNIDYQAYPVSSFFFSACIVLAIGITIYAVIRLVSQGFGKAKPLHTATRTALILMWIAAIVASIILGFKVTEHLWKGPRGFQHLKYKYDRLHDNDFGAIDIIDLEDLEDRVEDAIEKRVHKSKDGDTIGITHYNGKDTIVLEVRKNKGSTTASATKDTTTLPAQKAPQTEQKKKEPTKKAAPATTKPNKAVPKTSKGVKKDTLQGTQQL